jgi:HAD superfamily hydrolase (TIGR01509 family)
VIRAVLLDVDGTLLDSNDLHAEAWRVTLERAGFEVPFARVRELIGMGGDKLLPALTGLRDDSARGRELTQERQTLFLSELAPRARALPGARALVERILDAGQQPVVATSANAAELAVLLRRANVDDLLRQTTTSDDAERSKPDPDIVRAALDLAGVRPAEAVMVGDTPYDLKAAARAGVGFVGVRSGGYDDHALRGALALYQDAAELCARYEESPLHRPR